MLQVSIIKDLTKLVDVNLFEQPFFLIIKCFVNEPMDHFIVGQLSIA